MMSLLSRLVIMSWFAHNVVWLCDHCLDMISLLSHYLVIVSLFAHYVLLLCRHSLDIMSLLSRYYLIIWLFCHYLPIISFDSWPLSRRYVIIMSSFSYSNIQQLVLIISTFDCLDIWLSRHSIVSTLSDLIIMWPLVPRNHCAIWRLLKVLAMYIKSWANRMPTDIDLSVLAILQIPWAPVVMIVHTLLSRWILFRMSAANSYTQAIASWELIACFIDRICPWQETM